MTKIWGFLTKYYIWRSTALALLGGGPTKLKKICKDSKDLQREEIVEFYTWGDVFAHFARIGLAREFNDRFPPPEVLRFDMKSE
jgi:hypothetical protein